MMASRAILFVTCFIYSEVVCVFEEEVEGYVAGLGLKAKDNIETQSVLTKTPPIQLAASRQVDQSQQI